MKLTCCLVEEASGERCDEPATWQINDPGKHPVDGTVDSCDLHVWELLTDAEVQHVYQILGEDHYGGWKYEIKRAGAPR